MPDITSSTLPSFSIIVPTYNRRDMVDDAIESALNQDYDGEYEIVIADDGSSDGTPEFIEEHYGDKVKLFRQANAGPGPARNLAVKHARGEYLAMLDSDDQLMPWTLATYAQIIAQHNRPAIIMGQANIVGPDGKSQPIEQVPLDCRVFEDFYKARLALTELQTDRLVIRRDVFNDIGGFTDQIRVCEDVDLIARAGTAPGYVVIDAPVTFKRRVHGEQLTGTPHLVFAGRMFLLDREDCGELPGGKPYERLRQEFLTFMARIGACGMLLHGRRRDGWRFYFRTFIWQARMGRWKFLAGYPLLQLKALFFRLGDNTES